MDNAMSAEERQAWPILGYAPGSYQNKCAICGTLFMGDKLARMCIECAAKEVNRQIQEWKDIAESNRNANEEACKSVWALTEENKQLKLAASQPKHPTDEEVVKPFEDYIKFLEEAYNRVHGIAHIHHYQEKPEDVEKGEQLRATIKAHKSALQSQLSDPVLDLEVYVPCQYDEADHMTTLPKNELQLLKKVKIKDLITNK